MGRPALTRLVVVAVVAAAVVFASPSPGIGVTSGTRFGFGQPTLVSTDHAGGEPVIFVQANGPFAGTYLYASHAGTTHLYRPNGAGIPDFAIPYRNQTYIWRSADGVHWDFVDIAGTGVHSTGTGFSDPDFAEDDAGTLYEPEIDLANVTINSSADGGQTWLGNPYATSGDRPWLAAEGDGTVYLALDAAVTTDCQFEAMFKSTDGGLTFPTYSCPEQTYPDGSAMYGYGKQLIDPRTGTLVMAAIIQDAEGRKVGLGAEISSDGGQTWTGVRAFAENQFGFFPSLAEDGNGTVYLIWDAADAPVDFNGDCGCNERRSIAIRYAYSKDLGRTWSRPRDIVRAGRSVSGSPLWPWAVAGSKGMLGLAWYQGDKVVEADSQAANWSVFAAQIIGADTATPTVSVVNASRSVIHRGSICQEGVDCVLNGKDRRLGDYLTTYLDPSGFLMIAYANTAAFPDSPVSRPALVRQVSGPSFYR